MPLTDKITVVTQAIVDLLKADVSLELQDVWYGDQDLIPRYPAAAVESGLYTRRLAGANLQTENGLQVFVLVYHARIQDTQVTKKQCDEKAEAIMESLHTDVELGGLVTHGHVTAIEPGYSKRGGTLFRANRITWEGLTKTRI